MFTRARIDNIGSDGFVTLALSNLVLLISGGLLLALLFFQVLLTARRTSCHARSAGHRLVLGHVLRQSEPSSQFIERLERARALHATVPTAPILMLGGHTSPGGPSEAAAGRDYLCSLGVTEGLIVVEDRSLHTLENLQHARLLISDDNRPVLITNRYHLARSYVFASAVGLRVELCAAEDTASGSPKEWLRMLAEAYLLHWYHVGRSWSRLTANRRALARIS